MKCIKIGLCVIIAIIFGAFHVNTNPVTNDQGLGAKQCTWGPSYWCSNLENAKGCKAVRHCIQTVWEKQNVPVDDDSICKICKDMVTQARDQLRSNETMEELKEVFEGSCNLIPLKVVKKECCKLADDFIPELVEALSSQMNPDQVCSVAGLCNSEKIDKLLSAYYAAALDGSLKEEDVISSEPAAATAVKTKDVESSSSVAVSGKQPRQLSCGNCQQLGSLISNRFTAANRDDILENILHLCGEMSSFSDACANIVLTYFNDIYDNFKQSLTAQGMCHLSGVCSSKYHQHAEDLKSEQEEDITALSGVEGDDIPCELCEQLVKHLRDVLVANTTESEFKQVLEGLCNQTQGFKAECLSLVDQYYDVIYKALVDNLDANGACFMIGVCPKGKNSMFEGEIMPLLPPLPPAKIQVTIRKKLGANEPKFTQEELHSMALPIDHLMGAANPGLLVENGELCTMCEYLLHFIQETLATPSTEDEIKRTVNGVCNKLPNGLRGKCHDFIDLYGDAVIALLIQGLDPREVCPKLQMCPPNHENHDDMEVFDPKPIDHSEKPTCPLCLFAVEQAQQQIKNDKSKKNIKNVLDHLCSRLPSKLKTECDDFVETYTNELIDMLITDFKPQEICVALKLCENSNNFLSNLGISLEEEDDIEGGDNDSSEEHFSLNEIDSSDEMPIEIVFGQHIEKPTPNCWLCEEVIKTAEKKIGKKKSEEEIKRELDHACDKLRRNIRNECHKYISKYGDKIAILILKETEPKVICTELGLCLWSELEDLEIDEALKYDVIAMPNTKVSLSKSDRLTGLDDVMVVDPPSCVLCEFLMTKLEIELKNKSTQDEIKHTIENICTVMPKTVKHSCDKFIEQYANVIISLVSTVPPKEICQKIMLCFAGLEVINDEVIECGVCHGATMALLPYFRQHLEPKSITAQTMTTVACENLPAKYYQICADMISIYGPSILSLSEKTYMDDGHVCAEIGKCFDNEKSSLAFARITSE